MKSISFVILSLCVLVGCTKPSEYLEVIPQPVPQKPKINPVEPPPVEPPVVVKPPPPPPPPDAVYEEVSKVYNLYATENLVGAAELDILWVIDNSGSMSSYQQSVIKNADTFINSFTSKSKLKWKMGLISTSYNEVPYVGYSNTTPPLDYLSPDPIKIFSDAVAKLGTSGDGNERTFDPVLKSFYDFPDFLRSNAHLAVIVVTDEEEQSDDYDIGSPGFPPFLPPTPKTPLTNHCQDPADYCHNTSKTFMDRLIKMKGGNASKILQYGILLKSKSDFSFIQAKYKKHFETYAPQNIYDLETDFGVTLASIGEDLVTKITNLNNFILLDHKPALIDSIKVFYKGKALPQGLVQNGGVWIYEPTNNRIRILNMSAIDSSVTDVTVVYKKQIN